MTRIDLYALYRAARAASDLGHYNIAKLLSGAAASSINRSLYTESLPGTDQDFVAAVGAIEPMLIEAGLDPDLIESIRRARSLIAAGQLILHHDAPPIFVCRVCGEVARGEAPEQCLHCGAGQLVFQPFPAAFYLEPVPVDELLDQLARTPDWLDRVLSDLTPEQLTRQVGGVEGKWSLIEAAGHVLDTQKLIAYRVSLFMVHEAPNLSAKVMWQTVESASLSAQEIARQFRHSRAAMLAQLRTITPVHWTHVGQHTEFGPVTLQQQCSYFAKHEQWHWAQITRLRHAMMAN